MTADASLSAGFADPVHGAQEAFRRVLDALSRPGKPFTLGSHTSTSNLGPAMAQLLLALTDDDTPVWWQQQDSVAAQWLRFHTGASIAKSSSDAVFAVSLDASHLPALEMFSPGTAAAPEHSTTVLLEVSSFDVGPAIEWRGPGIQNTQSVRIAGLPEGFWLQWQANHAAFPQGVDIVFTCANAVLGLPRTTKVRRLESV